MTETTNPNVDEAPLCGDIDGTESLICARDAQHLGHHADVFGRGTWPLWYRDRSGDMWRTLSTDGELIALDGYPEDESELLGPVEDRFGPLVRVASVDAPEPETVPDTPHVCPELPDMPPSLEWAAALRPDDRAQLLVDVQYAAVKGLPELEQALRLWWVVAKEHPEHRLPVVDEAAVTAAPRVRGGLLGIADSGPLCDNCHGPGPLVPHPYDMQVCRTCYPEAESARAAQDGGAA